MKAVFADTIYWVASLNSRDQWHDAVVLAPEVKPEEVEDVVIGCATPEAQQGMNMARQAALLAGLPNSSSAVTINRFCSSGLQAIAQAAEHIMCGFSEVAIGGGAESM